MAEADNTEFFNISGTQARGRVSIRVRWWTLLGQPVEIYAMKWGIDEAAARPSELLEPFARSLPNGGDITSNPDVAEGFAELRSTDAGLRFHFEVRAPKGSIKGESFYQRCDANYCYAGGIRDLTRALLPMGKIDTWNTDISPGTPESNMVADWMEGCRVTQLECQQNTLRAATHMRITKLTVWKLTYNHSAAKKLVSEWAAAAQENSPETDAFRKRLADLTRPFPGSDNPDPVGAAAEAVTFYTDRLADSAILDRLAHQLEKSIWDSGNYSEEGKYTREVEAARRQITRMRDAATVALANAKTGAELSPEQVAELKSLQQTFASEERAIMAADGRASSDDRAGLNSTKVMKQLALSRLAGSLLPLGQKIDALKQEWGVSDDDNSFAQRASRLAGSLQRDLNRIDDRLTALAAAERKNAIEVARSEAPKSEPGTIVPTSGEEKAAALEEDRATRAPATPEELQMKGVYTYRFDGGKINWVEIIPNRLESYTTSNPKKNLGRSQFIYPHDNKQRIEAIAIHTTLYRVLEKDFDDSGLINYLKASEMYPHYVMGTGNEWRDAPGGKVVIFKKTSCDKFADCEF